MKKFICKSFVVALMVLPLVSHAKYCGGGYIENFTSGQGDNSYRYDHLKMNWSSAYPLNEQSGNGVGLHYSKGPAWDKLRSTALAAFFNGSFVRFATENAESCFNVTKIMVCKDEASCNRDF